MAESVALTVNGIADDVAGLAAWLNAEDELRGLVRLDPGPLSTGVLGADLPQLAVGVGSGGVATAMASAVIAWLRRRAGAVSLRVTRADGTAVELHAEHVHRLDATALQVQVAQLAALAWPEGEGPESGNDGAEGWVAKGADGE